MAPRRQRGSPRASRIGSGVRIPSRRRRTPAVCLAALSAQNYTITTGLPADCSCGVPGSGAPVQLTEEMLGDAMQLAYTNGASPTLWIVPPGPKRTVSTFVGRSTSQVMVGKTEVVSTVDVIATDFGRVKCIPSRWLPPDVGLLVDPDYAAVAFFRSHFGNISWRGSATPESRMIVVEWGLKCGIR